MTTKDFTLPDGGWGWMVVVGVALTNVRTKDFMTINVNPIKIRVFL